MKVIIRSIFTCLIACSVLMGLDARAQSDTLPEDALVDKLAKLVVRAMPFTEILQRMADKNPFWPMASKSEDVPKDVAAEQLECLRKSMTSAENYLALKRDRIKDFVASDSESARLAVALLEESEELMRDLTLAGASTGSSEEGEGKPGFSRYKPAQIKAFTDLASNPNHRALRALIGLPDPQTADSTAGNGFGDEITILMLTGMGHCKIPMSILQ